MESFAGYCDPTAVFNDIEPCSDITEERINTLREHDQNNSYVRALNDTYEPIKRYTGEVIFFVEQVTGHIIPDMRYALAFGVSGMIDRIKEAAENASDAQRTQYEAMKTALEAAVILARRYADIALKMMEGASGERRMQLELMRRSLLKVPEHGAETMYEAIQSFILLWQLMCIEQSPNPFAFSVGNADRLFESYRQSDNLTREEAAALFKHLLVFFNVGDRSWAISQNLIVGGRDVDGVDLTNTCSYALMDAYYDMNMPQPILSVKLHKNTHERMYAEIGRFFFTPGILTPSLFNDDSIFEVLTCAGVERGDLADYSIAGCQEPLIMGKDNGNTTNSWLNLGKILELTLSSGYSTVTGEKIGDVEPLLAPLELLKNIRELFYTNTKHYIGEMVNAANSASRAVSLLPVPFLSSLMGGIESGYDMRDTVHKGTKYNGSGCLIHGVSAVGDSFVAIDCLLRERPTDALRLIKALKSNFEEDEELRQYLLSCPKYGNGNETADNETAILTAKIADLVRAEKNYLGSPFRPDFSSPSTHLLYGYWVGALPSGRKAREMLNYGVDPLYGEANNGLGFRVLSTKKLPFEKMCGGYASHFGIDPNYFREETYDERGIELYKKVLKPLFFSSNIGETAPFYLYINVTTPEMLRKVLAEPDKYAPSGVYIMRIHGTFVNFLDLSPAIQQDIIKRLDLKSTAL